MTRLWTSLALALQALSLCADDASQPVNCNVSVTLVRCPSAGPASEILRGCARPEQILETLRAAAKGSLVYYAVRPVACQDSAAVAFTALERRPVVLFGPDTATNVVHDYGMDLRLQVRAVSQETAPLYVMDWSGSWSDSPKLMAKWEALAVRGFNAASKIPGIVYQKTEEDEDGFVNTTGGVDISGWFKKKPKAPQPAVSTNPAEPDYLDDVAFESVALEGQCVLRRGGLAVARERIGAPAQSGEIFLLISVN